MTASREGAGPDAAQAAAAARAAVQRWEPWLGAVVALAAPRPARPGPLAGLRLGIKELAAVAGLPRQSGAPDLVPATPMPADAPAVGRLVAAGATLVATTATHQFAYGIITPQTRNPRAPERVAGGSSGGSAAALAAGIVDVALGTDTGGSVRIPAACCGVVGLKTTHGLVPVDGVQPLAPSLDTVGPLARSVAACAAAFRVLAGLAAPEPPGPPATLRVGLVRELDTAGIDADVRQVYEATAADLRAWGATLRRVPLPLLPSANAANGQILGAEALDVHRALLAARPGPQGWAPDVRDRLERASKADPGLVASARETAGRWREQVGAAFADVDVLVLPTLPCRVPLVGADPVPVAGRPQPVTAALTRFTNPWNLAGVPAGSVPAGRDGEGAPVGVQVVGPWHREAVVLDAMALVEQLRGGPWPPVPGPPR